MSDIGQSTIVGSIAGSDYVLAIVAGKVKRVPASSVFLPTGYQSKVGLTFNPPTPARGDWYFCDETGTYTHFGNQYATKNDNFIWNGTTWDHIGYTNLLETGYKGVKEPADAAIADPENSWWVRCGSNGTYTNFSNLAANAGDLLIYNTALAAWEKQVGNAGIYTLGQNLNGAGYKGTGFASGTSDGELVVFEQLAELADTRVSFTPGKNILDPNMVEGGKAINTSGVIISAAGVDLTPKLYFNGNPSITCSCCVNGGGYSFFAVYDSSDNFIGGNYAGTIKTVNAADYAGASYVRFPITQTANRQAEYGNEATDYLAFNSIGGQVEPLELGKVDVVPGRNILNPDEVLTGKTVNTSGVIISAAGVDLTPKLYFNGNPSITCDSCVQGGGYSFFAVYKADNTFIGGNYCTTVKTVNAADYADSAYVRFPLTQTTERQCEYNTAATEFRPYNEIGAYVEVIKDDIDTINDDLLERVDKNFGVNLIDPDQVTWGKALNSSGAIVTSAAAYGITPKMYFNGHGSFYSASLYRALNDGYYLTYYKADGTVISTSRIFPGGIVPIVTDAAYIISTINRSYKDYNLKVEYGDVKSNVYTVPFNPIGRYTDNTPIALYAYADGDATPDVDNLFYGDKGYWKAWYNAGSGVTYYTIDETPVVDITRTYSSTLNHGTLHYVVRYYDVTNGISFDDTTYYVRDDSKDLNVGAIQRAINSCEEGRKYIIYCKGHFLFNTAAQFAGNRSSLYAMVWMQNANVTLQGDGIYKTIIEVDLPSNLGVGFAYNNYSPVEFYDGIINDLSIIGHNCRYAVHCVGAVKAEMNRVRIWHIPNVGDAYTVWPSTTTLGIGTRDSSKIYLNDCDIVDEGDPLYIHDNNAQEYGYHYLVKDTRLICKGTTSDMGRIAALFVLNSPSHSVFELKNVALGNRRRIAVGQDSSWSTTVLFPEIYTRIIGDVNVPIHYSYGVGIGRVLKITSNTTGATSTVRFDKTSSAFAVLIEGDLVTDFSNPNGIIHADNYRYRDGETGLAGYAVGELPIDPGTTGKMQTRLGDCTGTPLSLIITIDGTAKTVTFDQDYTAYSDVNMLAVINTAISGFGVAEVYVLGKEYYPEFNRNIEQLPNNSASLILAGMGVNMANGSVAAATTDAEVQGIALDDIKIGYIGRIAKKAYLPTTENRFKIKLASQATCSAGDKFKISATPGVFELDNSTGTFVAEYASLIKIDL